MRDIFDRIFIKNKHWYRTGRGTICQIIGSSGEYTDNYGITKVADTPQELIEVGDLVALDHHPKYIKIVLDIEGNLILFNSSRCVLNQVCKILTPNSNGGYDLQWVGCREDEN